MQRCSGLFVPSALAKGAGIYLLYVSLTPLKGAEIIKVRGEVLPKFLLCIQQHILSNIFIYCSVIPPNIPMNDSNPGLCDTLSHNAIARSYPNSNW
jgi:hypothetical protein